MTKGSLTIAFLSALLLAPGCGKKTFIEMVDVEGGFFMMGAHNIELQWASNIEFPAHPVKLDDYRIGKYPVTVGQFSRFVEESGYRTLVEREDDPMHGLCWIVDTTGGTERHCRVDTVDWRHDMHGKLIGRDRYDLPVTNVAQEDALAFCRWLSEKEGKEYDLPSEAQWEFAARGGNESNDFFASGSNDVDKVAWITENSGGIVHPVGKKSPNELGIYDMSGNVREWVLDKAMTYSIAADTLVNPVRLSNGKTSIARGCSVNQSRAYCRNSYRGVIRTEERGGGLGFRVVIRTVPNEIVE